MKQIWLDFFEASTVLNEQAPEPGVITRVAGMKPLDLLRVKDRAEVPVEHTFSFDDLDREVAIVWMALQRALRQPEAVDLPDGGALLSLSAGIIAQLDIRRIGPSRDDERESKVRATLEAEWSSIPKVQRYSDQKLEYQPAELYVRRETLAAVTNGADTHLAYSLPRRLHLAGHGLRADVTFLVSPLLHEAVPRAVLQAAPAAAHLEREAVSQREEVERQRREMDDDE